MRSQRNWAAKSTSRLLLYSIDKEWHTQSFLKRPCVQTIGLLFIRTIFLQIGPKLRFINFLFAVQSKSNQKRSLASLQVKSSLSPYIHKTYKNKAMFFLVSMPKEEHANSKCMYVGRTARGSADSCFTDVLWRVSNNDFYASVIIHGNRIIGGLSMQTGWFIQIRIKIKAYQLRENLRQHLTGNPSPTTCCLAWNQ